MYLKWGTVGEGEKGMGSRWGGGGQYTANQGSDWKGIAPPRKGGIPSKEKGSSGTGAGIPSKGVIKGIGLCTPISC
jgi:hypothetical protein